MQGYKEILASFTVGCLTLGTFAQITGFMKSKERFAPVTPPTQLQGRSEDPRVSLSWGLKEIGASEAWSIERGRADIKVAVIDTGCDIHHPELIPNIWTNPGETGLDEDGNPKSSNGIDDDGNGFIDDVHGWNFASDTPDVMDEHGHGTHIAGIIGSTRTGVSPHVSLMILKYYDEDTTGEQNLHNTVQAIHYAVKMGAQIINYSGGGILKSDSEKEAIAWAESKGVLFVAAAGNEGLNSDFFHFYPANYGLRNILSVAATDRYGRLLDISNFGKATVDIAAPGKNIYSTLPNGQHGFMTGTSQATAFVSGLAALMMARSEVYRQPSAVIHALLTHGRPLPALKGRTRSEAMIQAYRAVSASPSEQAENLVSGF